MKERVKKSLAKKFLWLILTVLVVMVAMILGFATKPARAEYEASIQGGTLVIKEVFSTKYVAGVPVGLSSNKAFELVMGKEKSVVIKDELGNTNYSFSLPWVKSRTEYNDKIVAYRIYNGPRYTDPWLVNPLPSRFVSDDERIVSGLYLWIPSLFILVMSIKKSLPAIWTKKLLICYVAMFAGILAGTFVGWIVPYADEVTRMCVGMIVGLIVGMTAGIFSGGGIIGGIAAMLTGGMSGVFAGGQQYKLILYVSLFLLVVEAISFGITILFVKGREKMNGLQRQGSTSAS